MISITKSILILLSSSAITIGGVHNTTDLQTESIKYKTSSLSKVTVNTSECVKGRDHKVALIISPAIFNIKENTKKGQIKNLTIKVTNKSSCPQTVKLTPSELIKTENYEFSLNIGETKSVNLVIDVLDSEPTGKKSEYVYVQTTTKSEEQRIILKSNINFNVTE